MKLLELIRKRDFATATPATDATVANEGGVAGVASVAGVAVANTETETTIRAWLAHVSETDQEIINDVLDKCRDDADARAYFLRRASVAGVAGVAVTNTETETIQAALAKPKPFRQTQLERQREARRAMVIAMLEDNPGRQRVYYTDSDSDLSNIILAIGIRGVATFDMEIPRESYDPFLLLTMIDDDAQTH